MNPQHGHYQDAIIDLHDKGYIEDFVLFGDELLWVQKKTFIDGADFSIIECHTFAYPGRSVEDLVIFGIMMLYENVKGILMNHYTFSSRVPDIIVNKINGITFY